MSIPSVQSETGSSATPSYTRTRDDFLGAWKKWDYRTVYRLLQTDGFLGELMCWNFDDFHYQLKEGFSRQASAELGAASTAEFLQIVRLGSVHPSALTPGCQNNPSPVYFLLQGYAQLRADGRVSASDLSGFVMAMVQLQYWDEVHPILQHRLDDLDPDALEMVVERFPNKGEPAFPELVTQILTRIKNGGDPFSTMSIGKWAALLREHGHKMALHHIVGHWQQYTKLAFDIPGDPPGSAFNTAKFLAINYPYRLKDFLCRELRDNKIGSVFEILRFENPITHVSIVLSGPPDFVGTVLYRIVQKMITILPSMKETILKPGPDAARCHQYAAIVDLLMQSAKLPEVHQHTLREVVSMVCEHRANPICKKIQNTLLPFIHSQ